MKIHIKNIGMLDEADFEVGNLTIICGENNTGKTYATYSLYGYLDFIRGNSNYTITNINTIRNIIKKHLEFIEVEDDRMQISIEELKNILKELLEESQKDYIRILAEVLAGKDGDFEKSIFEDDKLLILCQTIEEVTREKGKEKFENFFEFSSAFNILEITNESVSFDYKKSEKYFTETMRKNISIKKEQFLISLFLYILNRIYPKPFILSAERTGATMFQKELDVNKNEIVEKISMADEKNVKEMVFSVLSARYSRYPKPVKDNIYFVRDLDEVVKQISFIKRNEKENLLHKEIIKLLYQVVGGKYVVSAEGIEFAPGAKIRITKGKFLVQRASSSVRSLLILYYYIFHIAEENDILMIDEPELNLHPNNQILMGKLIALLVNAGVKVFITTHSDYIVREISNCIMLNNIPDEEMDKMDKFKKQGYSKEYKMESNKIRAYLAKNIKGKNTLEKVEITQEQGIFIKTFDEPIESQNDNQGFIFEELMKHKRNNNDK